MQINHAVFVYWTNTVHFTTQREEELVSAWWKEYAEVSEGPVTASGRLAPDTREQREVPKGDVKSLSRTSSAGKDQIPYGGNNPDSDDGESVGVLVKGGLYEVCVFSMLRVLIKLGFPLGGLLHSFFCDGGGLDTA